MAPLRAPSAVAAALLALLAITDTVMGQQSPSLPASGGQASGSTASGNRRMMQTGSGNYDFINLPGSAYTAHPSCANVGDNSPFALGFWYPTPAFFAGGPNYNFCFLATAQRLLGPSCTGDCCTVDKIEMALTPGCKVPLKFTVYAGGFAPLSPISPWINKFSSFSLNTAPPAVKLTGISGYDYNTLASTNPLAYFCFNLDPNNAACDTPLEAFNNPTVANPRVFAVFSKNPVTGKYTCCGASQIF